METLLSSGDNFYILFDSSDFFFSNESNQTVLRGAQFIFSDGAVGSRNRNFSRWYGNFTSIIGTGHAASSTIEYFFY